MLGPLPPVKGREHPRVQAAEVTSGGMHMCPGGHGSRGTSGMSLDALLAPYGGRWREGILSDTQGAYWDNHA
jgi:hypothetical protein